MDKIDGIIGNEEFDNPLLCILILPVLALRIGHIGRGNQQRCAIGVWYVYRYRPRNRREHTGRYQLWLNGR